MLGIGARVLVQSHLLPTASPPSSDSLPLREWIWSLRLYLVDKVERGQQGSIQSPTISLSDEMHDSVIALDRTVKLALEKESKHVILADLSHVGALVECVTVYLHATFKEPKRVLYPKNLFVIQEQGWGEFSMRFRVSFHDACQIQEMTFENQLEFSQDEYIQWSFVPLKSDKSVRSKLEHFKTLCKNVLPEEEPHGKRQKIESESTLEELAESLSQLKPPLTDLLYRRLLQSWSCKVYRDNGIKVDLDLSHLTRKQLNELNQFLNENK